MSVWRPATRIGVKALGLHWRDDKLLAAEVRGDDGQVNGVRPLGGGLEPGESAKAAVCREFQEELGIDVAVHGDPIVLENIFVHEGIQGHEVVFVFEVAFPSGAFDGRDQIAFRESDGTLCLARWYGLDDFDGDNGIALFPTGLRSRLGRNTSKRIVCEARRHSLSEIGDAAERVDGLRQVEGIGIIGEAVEPRRSIVEHAPNGDGLIERPAVDATPAIGKAYGRTHCGGHGADRGKHQGAATFAACPSESPGKNNRRH